MASPNRGVESLATSVPHEVRFSTPPTESGVRPSERRGDNITNSGSQTKGLIQQKKKGVHTQMSEISEASKAVLRHQALEVEQARCRAENVLRDSERMDIQQIATLFDTASGVVRTWIKLGLLPAYTSGPEDTLVRLRPHDPTKWESVWVHTSDIVKMLQAPPATVAGWEHAIEAWREAVWTYGTVAAAIEQSRGTHARTR